MRGNEETFAADQFKIEASVLRLSFDNGEVARSHLIIFRNPPGSKYSTVYIPPDRKRKIWKQSLVSACPSEQCSGKRELAGGPIGTPMCDCRLEGTMLNCTE